MDLSTWITRHAGQTPDKLALRFPGRDLSYAQLAAQVGQFARALSARGVMRGRCVAYLGCNSPETLILLFACARLGALFMPLNWRLAGPEHNQMLADCPPTVLLVEPPFVAQADACRQALADTCTCAVALGQDQAIPPGWISNEQFLAGGQGKALPAASVDGDTPLLICYTSGSTGKPKGVVLSQDALAWNAANSIDMHGLTAEDIILTTLPLFHVGGLNILTTPALRAGCTVVLLPRFEPEAALAAIERERITLTVVVPAVMEALMALPRWQSADLSSLRMFSIGSSIVPERLIHASHARGVPMVQVYGSTETCPIAVYQKVEEARRQVGSTGRAAAHCQVRVVDDAGKVLGAGVSGEIQVRGPNVMSGYWRAPRASAEAFVDGWYRSGDMGHWDEDGFLYVDGRRKELIISGGENIYPAEIENVLIECEQIAEAAVVGRPDRRWGESVVAVVVPKAGASLSREQVLKLFEGRIARYKHPKDVVFVAELPKTALGKVRKEDVRNMVNAEEICQH